MKIPGAELRGVFKLDHLDDARAILAYISPRHIRRARTAVVTGGGITALELAEGLRAQGLRVHYLLRGDRYWSNVLDETESRMVEARLAHEGVQIHFGTELAEIYGRKGQVGGVRPREGEPLACDMVAFAIGVKPRLELAAAAGLRIERGILVDEMLRTSEPDIFAAGDVAQVFDPLSGQSVLDTLWNTARDQGRAAGLNMAGAAGSNQAAAYRKNVPINITRLGGLTTTIIGMVGKGVDPSLAGIARGDSETWRQLPVHSVVESRRADSRLRLLISDNRLLGAVVMGDQAVSLQLQELISNAADITPVRSALLHTAQPSEIITAFWQNWRSSNHAEPQP